MKINQNFIQCISLCLKFIIFQDELEVHLESTNLFGIVPLKPSKLLKNMKLSEASQKSVFSPFVEHADYIFAKIFGRHSNFYFLLGQLR